MKTTIEEMAKLKTHSKEWFDAAFEDVNVPEAVKQASIQICHSFGIRGQSDPAYIANVINLSLTHEQTQQSFNKKFFKHQ